MSRFEYNLFSFIRGVVSFIFGLIEFFLVFRFILKLLGASSTADFVAWIYSMTQSLLDPFRGIFPATVFEDRYILEFTTLFAIIVYAILYLAIVEVIYFFERMAARD